MADDPYPDGASVHSGQQNESAAEDCDDNALGDDDEEGEEDEEDEYGEEGSPAFRERAPDLDDDDVFDKRTFLSPKKRGKRPRSRPRKTEPEDTKNNYPTSRQAPADHGWHEIATGLTLDAANDLMRSHAKAHAPECGFRRTGSRAIRSNGSWWELQQCGYVAEVPPCPALRCLDYHPDDTGVGTYSISVSTGDAYEHNNHDEYRVKGPPGAVYSLLPHRHATRSTTPNSLPQHSCYPAPSLVGYL
jgi:hypothetical protein